MEGPFFCLPQHPTQTFTLAFSTNSALQAPQENILFDFTCAAPLRVYVPCWSLNISQLPNIHR